MHPFSLLLAQTLPLNHSFGSRTGDLCKHIACFQSEVHSSFLSTESFSFSPCNPQTRHHTQTQQTLLHPPRRYNAPPPGYCRHFFWLVTKLAPVGPGKVRCSLQPALATSSLPCPATSSKCCTKLPTPIRARGGTATPSPQARPLQAELPSSETCSFNIL